MKNSLTPKTQDELDARIEEGNRHQETWTADSIVRMLGGACIGGCISPLVLHYRYCTAAWMANPMGVTHGGMLASMLDNAMGITAFIISPHGKAAPTAELHISYLRPVPLETELSIRVFADHVGSRLIRMRAELRVYGDENTVYVTASGANCPIQSEI